MISGYLIGDKQMIARLTKVGPAVMDAAARAVDTIGVSLQNTVVKDYLSGPRPIHLARKHGRLASSISRWHPETRSRFVRIGEVATAYVGTNVPYGAFWEYGFNMKVGAGARGGPRSIMASKFPSPRALATYYAKHPPGVKRIAPRAFLKPALAQRQAEFVVAIQRAVTQAAQAAMKS